MRVSAYAFNVGRGEHSPTVSITSDFWNLLVKKPAFQCYRRDAYLLRCLLKPDRGFANRHSRINPYPTISPVDHWIMRDRNIAVGPELDSYLIITAYRLPRELLHALVSRMVLENRGSVHAVAREKTLGNRVGERMRSACKGVCVCWSYTVPALVKVCVALKVPETRMVLISPDLYGSPTPDLASFLVLPSRRYR